MAKTIAVNADTRGFKKNIMDLSREIDKSLGGKRSIQLFDKETRQFVERGAKIAIKDMKNVMGELEAANKKISKEMNSQKLSQEEIRKKSLEQLRNKKQLLKLERDIAGVQRASGRIGMGAGGRFGKGFKGGTRGLAGKIPGMGGMARAGAAGLGMAGLAGGVLGLGALGLGALAVGRGMQGFNRFDATKESRIGLMGRGMTAGQSTGMFAPAQQIGLKAADLRGAQMQGMDIFGRGGSTMEKTTDRARAARGLGIGVEQFQAAGAGLQQQMGVSGAQKSFAKMQAALIATDTKGAVGPWLETMSSMLTNINEHGLGLDDAALTAISAIGEIEGVGPQRAAKVFGGLDDAMKNAQGENAAFFMSALASKGVGGGTLGGTQVAMQMGLFGGDTSKMRERGLLSDKDISALEDMKIAVDPTATKGKGLGAFQDRVGGIVDMFDKITGGMGVAGKALTAQKITGIQNPVAALEAMEMARKARTAKTPEERSQAMKEIGKLLQTPQEKMASNLELIQKSTAGILQVSQAFKDANLEQLGGKLVPLAALMNDTLTNIDKVMSGIIRLFGGETAQEAVESKAKAGKLSLEEFKGMTPRRQKEIQDTSQKEIVRVMERREHLTKLDKTMQGGKSGMNFHTQEIKELGETESRLEKILVLQLIEMRKKRQKPGVKTGRGSTVN